MRSRIAAVSLTALGLLVAVTAVGCRVASGSVPPISDKPVIRVSGAGGCLPLVRTLCEAYPRRDEVEFFFIPGLHASGAVLGVRDGDLDIGALSRPLGAEDQKHGLEYSELSRDGLVIAAHPSVSVASLTSAQVRDVYLGSVRNWRELGGPDLPIVVLDRNEDDSAKIVLRRHVLGDGRETSSTAHLDYEDDMVQGLEQTPGAIGYCSLGLVESRRAWVRLLMLDGVAPSVRAIEEGRYSPVRMLGVIVRPDATPAVRAFVDWTKGPEAVKLMEEKGWAAAGAAQQ